MPPRRPTASQQRRAVLSRCLTRVIEQNAHIIFSLNDSTTTTKLSQHYVPRGAQRKFRHEPRPPKGPVGRSDHWCPGLRAAGAPSECRRPSRHHNPSVCPCSSDQLPQIAFPAWRPEPHMFQTGPCRISKKAKFFELLVHQGANPRQPTEAVRNAFARCHCCKQSTTGLQLHHQTSRGRSKFIVHGSGGVWIT